jgi:MFS family permease
LLLSCAPALATSLYDESRRTWVLGVYAGMAVLAGVIAPLIGGVSVALLGWAGVFWFRAPIALLALAMLPWLPGVSTPLAPGALRAFDFAGSLSLAAGLGLLLLAPALLQAGGAAAPAALSAIAGAGLLALFIRRQGAHAGPLLPRALVGEADFILPNLVSTALHVTTFSIPLLVPYYLVRIAGWGPLQSGLLLSAWAIGGLAGSALAERTVRALGARPAAFAGGLLAAAGLAGVSTWPDHARLGWMIAPLLLQGVGIGIFQVAYTDLIVGSLPRSSRGVAGSLTMLTRTVGIVVGASLLTAALHQSESAQLAAGVAAKAAFLGGFQTVLRGAGFGLLAVLALSALRRGLWFGMPRR